MTIQCVLSDKLALGNNLDLPTLGSFSYAPPSLDIEADSRGLPTFSVAWKVSQSAALWPLGPRLPIPVKYDVSPDKLTGCVGQC